jgi:hypothetical protein
MSEPTRYNGLEQDDEGVYVLYSEYATLLDRLSTARKEELAARLRVEELEVVRYAFYGDWDGNAVEKENEIGGWVRYSDYEALAAENKRLREALERVRGFCEPEPWPSGPPITLCFLHDIVDAALREPTDD